MASLSCQLDIRLSVVVFSSCFVTGFCSLKRFLYRSGHGRCEDTQHERRVAKGWRGSKSNIRSTTYSAYFNQPEVPLGMLLVAVDNPYVSKHAIPNFVLLLADGFAFNPLYPSTSVFVFPLLQIIQVLPSVLLTFRMSYLIAQSNPFVFVDLICVERTRVWYWRLAFSKTESSEFHLPKLRPQAQLPVIPAYSQTVDFENLTSKSSRQIQLKEKKKGHISVSETDVSASEPNR